MKRTIVTLTCLLVASLMTFASTKSLYQLQQEFVDLRFGMFIHYNIPTYAPEDWPDPDLPASAFNPKETHSDPCLLRHIPTQPR